MRRRNAKKVAFTDPTYYEPSENGYSTEGENEDELEFMTVADVAREDMDETRTPEVDGDIVEPLHVRHAQKSALTVEEKESASGDTTPQPDDGLTPGTTPQEDQSRASSDTLDTTGLSIAYQLYQDSADCRQTSSESSKVTEKCGTRTLSTKTRTSRRERSILRPVSCVMTLHLGTQILSLKR